ncbi:uncharacterized protein EI97DRAFT_428947 [Westerdykella ornata]|uniref:Uncharacterized protein n=1 Tax=Westerdykella ornata TaxID=318751 RepID=A0A6A6JW57_WESOR|nr:uncharacterized protein EI97DRAFT_428947 [Westerdykella ornata]KAF2280850.1 hypothetical protein EI97DRAFT_428947 [Westerdykella ornata]
MKEEENVDGEKGVGGGLEKLRRPELWDEEFKRVLGKVEALAARDADEQPRLSTPFTASPIRPSSTLPTNLTHSTISTLTLFNLASPPPPFTPLPITAQLTSILSTLSTLLSTHHLPPTSISHTTLLLRHMSDFAAANRIYSPAFDFVNPPSRVTVACGERMPEGVDVMMSVVAERTVGNGVRGRGRGRKGLHVQSRSYWAPANIGPYSQGIGVLLPQASSPAEDDADDGGSWTAEVETSAEEEDERRGREEEQEEEEPQDEPQIHLVYPAGQIPLVPSSMTLLTGPSFTAQVALSLQHLWRVGRAMEVRWWVVGVAYLSHCPEEEEKEEGGGEEEGKGKEEVTRRVRIAAETWRAIHEEFLPKTSQEGEASNSDSDSDSDDAIDPWDLQNRFHGTLPASHAAASDITFRAPIPDPSVLLPPPSPSPSSLDGKTGPARKRCIPPLVVPQVRSLPRDAPIEWWSLGLASPSTTAAEGFKLRFHAGEETDGGEEVHVTEVMGTPTRFFTLRIPFPVMATPESTRQRIVRALSSLAPSSSGGERNDGVSGRVEWEHCMLFAGPELWSEWSGVVAGCHWVPCERVWIHQDGDGTEEVAGVVLGRVSVY